MTVMVRKKKQIRGRLRAQVKEAIKVGLELLDAHGKNPDLTIFAPGVGPGSATLFEAQLAQWSASLNFLVPVY
jgi:hypothetical protein